MNQNDDDIVFQILVSTWNSSSYDVKEAFLSYLRKQERPVFNPQA
jgi:hypothetical protein